MLCAPARSSTTNLHVGLVCSLLCGSLACERPSSEAKDAVFNADAAATADAFWADAITNHDVGLDDTNQTNADVTAQDGQTVLPDAAVDDISSADDAVSNVDAGGPISYSYTCNALGTAFSDGIFSLESFQGKVYAGLFGYGHEAQSMLYSYPEWQLTAPGLTGISESVCMLRRHGDVLYANTESSGDIFVSSNGSNWTREYNGDPQSIGCGLAELDGVMYAVNYNYGNLTHGRILQRQANGSWNIVYDSGSESLYLREIVEYDGTLYAFGVSDGQGSMMTSSNGTQWTRSQTPARMFRGYVHNGLLWVGSSSSSSASSVVGIWYFDGTTFTRVFDSPGQHVTDVKALDGHMFASTSNGWKTDPGPSYLLASEDDGQNWRSVCTFSDTAVWKMTVNDGELYVGTWSFNGHGQLYHVAITESATRDDVDCSLISAANSRWEVCQTGPNFCAGVYSDGAGCQAYCAAAGLQCVARFGGDENCIKEAQNPIACDAVNQNQTDWCECAGTTGVDAGSPDSGGAEPSCTPQAGSMSVGQTYTLNVDSHSGDEATAEPKTDSNDGLLGDNPRYRRHNVTHAHNDYWYTSAYISDGNALPSSEQWVDYMPDFTSLGVGCYHIVARYRATSARATYAAQYHVVNSASGDLLIERVQQRGDGEYYNEDLGKHLMCSDAFVRIQDPGSASITFNDMRFSYLGPTCP